MRSFKKMLAAVSAVTIAFGAMALQAGAFTEITLDDGEGKAAGAVNNVSVGSPSELGVTSKGYLVVEYTAAEEPALRFVTDDTNWHWDVAWDANPDESSFTANEASYKAFAYETIDDFAETKGYTIDTATRISIQTQGQWKDAWVSCPATITNVYWLDTATYSKDMSNWGWGTEEFLPENLAETQGKYVVKYKALPGTDVYMTLNSDADKKVTATSSTTVNGITTAEYSYSDIITAAGGSVTSADKIVLANRSGDAAYEVQAPTYYPSKVVATEIEQMIENIDNDGWYARTFTFSYGTDNTVTYSVNINGTEFSDDTSITGTVVYGIVVGSKDKDKLANLAAPVITIK